MSSLVAVAVALITLYALTRWVMSFDPPAPPDDDGDNDNNGGSDRLPPNEPWWPSGITPDRDKELV